MEGEHRVNAWAGVSGVDRRVPQDEWEAGE